MIATAGSAEKCEACVSLGADVAINYRTRDFVDVIKGDAGGVDVILDMVGGDYTTRNLKCLNTDGRLVQIAFLKGSKIEVDMLPVMVKRLTVTGSTLRPRDVAFKGRLAAALREQVWPLLAAKTVSPRIDQTFPLEQAGEAHRHLESGGHVGKIVLKVG